MNIKWHILQALPCSYNCFMTLLTAYELYYRTFTNLQMHLFGYITEYKHWVVYKTCLNCATSTFNIGNVTPLNKYKQRTKKYWEYVRDFWWETLHVANMGTLKDKIIFWSTRKLECSGYFLWKMQLKMSFQNSKSMWESVSWVPKIKNIKQGLMQISLPPIRLFVICNASAKQRCMFFWLHQMSSQIISNITIYFFFSSWCSLMCLA